MLKINQQLDCTQRQAVIDIARIVYQTHGHRLPNDPDYLWNSQHPTEQSVLRAAEEIFEIFWGDSPDYSDEEE